MERKRLLRDSIFKFQGGIMKFKFIIVSAISLIIFFLNIGSGDCREVRQVLN